MEDILKRLEKYYHKYIRGTLNINQFIFNVFFAEIGGLSAFSNAEIGGLSAFSNAEIGGLMIDTNAIFGYTMFIGGINSCSKEKYIIKLKNGKILHKVKQLY
ncbi:hypothetical protein OCV55_06250 [Clostridium ammoniilyticum]|uniref:Uncharacterized protein n=1 Tax=[Clostridium] ammoniilyticum TaxID=2981784 RepID=A0ABT2STW4_9FIRM|nr:hypothetical protein [[Clostridium] ammoniilyticum]MCU6738279.1 hypothetical protein [[Clostridium] ammoniilyticum]